jgi:endonuclease V-like protein UPF0215 family
MPSVLPAGVIVGGFNPIDVDNLTEDQKAVDEFIRKE